MRRVDAAGDVTGGMFGAIGILGALHQRNATGKGQKVVASLYESTVFLVGQHMAQKAVTGKAAAPMPARLSGISPAVSRDEGSWC